MREIVDIGDMMQMGMNSS